MVPSIGERACDLNRPKTLLSLREFRLLQQLPLLFCAHNLSRLRAEYSRDLRRSRVGHSLVGQFLQQRLPIGPYRLFERVLPPLSGSLRSFRIVKPVVTLRPGVYAYAINQTSERLGVKNVKLIGYMELTFSVFSSFES